MKIRFLGAHNTETDTTGLMCLLLDDVIALDAGSLTSHLSLNRQLALKGALVTHPHYDHMRDLPMLAMNCFLNGGRVHIYGSREVKDALSANILNGKIYSNFFDRPVMDFHLTEPDCPFEVNGYEVVPVKVDHSVPANGYLVQSAGRSFFYTGDTGPGLKETWQRVSPEILVIEVTASSRFNAFGRESKHLTPDLLKDELITFRDIRGYLPRVVTVHMNPSLETEIRRELHLMAAELGCEISMAYEGLEIEF